MFVKCFVLIFLILFQILCANAQELPEKDPKWHKRRMAIEWDSLHLFIKPNLNDKSILGKAKLTCTLLEATDSVQIDLNPNLIIDELLLNSKPIAFTRPKNTRKVLIAAPAEQGSSFILTIVYHGNPPLAKNPPWDGGFVWQQTKNETPWIGVACQSMGASSWWPCIDHPRAKPAYSVITVEVHNSLQAICNGSLDRIDTIGENTQWHWEIKNKINTYNITINIGNYVLVSDTFLSNHAGVQTLSWYALPHNESKAIIALEQAKNMLTIYEKLIGSYPFYNDGFKVVETPYWGMEHQSCIAYGNDYKLNKFGFDFILLHESGHEWFGNLITHKDIADMWIHEGFTTYLETMYLRATASDSVALAYIHSQRSRIRNKQPVIGPKEVNYKTDTDAYFKAAWMLETIKSSLGNEQLFNRTMHEFVNKFKFQIIDSESAINFWCSAIGEDFRYLFVQYLYELELPTLNIRKHKNGKFTVWLDSSNPKFYLNFHNLNGNLLKIGKQKIVIPNSIKEKLTQSAQNYLINIRLL